MGRFSLEQIYKLCNGSVNWTYLACDTRMPLKVFIEFFSGFKNQITFFTVYLRDIGL